MHSLAIRQFVGYCCLVASTYVLCRRQIGEDLLRKRKGSLWGHFAAPPHSPESLILWILIKCFDPFKALNNLELISQELAESAISTYKHIGRIRSARMVGLELAKFYLEMGQVINHF